MLDRSYLECANILYDSILMFKNGPVQAQKQKELYNQGFYCSQRKVGDEILNWNQKSREIFNLNCSNLNPIELPFPHRANTKICFPKQFSHKIPQS